MHIRIATRRSALALWQAEHVADRLRRVAPDSTVTLVPMSTRGDEVLDRSLQKIGGKGLFIKELEVAMQEGRADIAVHSMKDVPAVMPEGFRLAAILKRGNPADALIASRDIRLRDLPEGARVGSSSLRRQAQVLALRPDVTVLPLRGNVQTRLRKLDDGEYDAILLAAAGLERLGLRRRMTEILTPEDMLPAAAQGVIGVECCDDQPELSELLAKLTHAPSETTTLAERAIAETLNASCHSPVASFATLDGTQLILEALVARADGSLVLRKRANGPASDAVALGVALANALLTAGAAEILAESAA